MNDFLPNDTVIIEYLQNHALLLGSVIYVLKILAKRSKNVYDDSILTLVGEWLSFMRIGKHDKPVPKCEEEPVVDKEEPVRKSTVETFRKKS